MTIAAAFGASPAVAETPWKPSGPINVLMHTKPGGTADIFIRTLAQSIEPLIGQTIVVVNTPGAGGATQMARVAHQTRWFDTRAGTIDIGGFGPVGSMQHLGTSMLEKAAGVKINSARSEEHVYGVAAADG